MSSKSHKKFDIVVRLLELASESFSLESNFERHKLVYTGKLVYPHFPNQMVVLNFQNKPVQPDAKFSYTESATDLYREQDFLGVLYAKEDGVDYQNSEELVIYLDVSTAFIQKISQIKTMSCDATLSLKALVGRQFMKDTYQEPKTSELRQLAEFEDIDTSQLVTCAVTEIDLSVKHQIRS
ncbi:hypothetical protein N9J51_00295 [Alphaproteobacteria bacterium]|jgi:hypothetical protein|nr:hypothetical protein [Alphaproteobacteria bacterium]